MSKIIVIGEDAERSNVFFQQLHKMNIPYEYWDTRKCLLSAHDIPNPNHVYYCRESPSAFTRGNRTSHLVAKSLVDWLELNNCTLVNSPTSLKLEMSKSHQAMILKSEGFSVPRTFTCANYSDLEACVKNNYPNADAKFMIKSNMGGSGYMVSLFKSKKQFELEIKAKAIRTIDGLYVVQDYIVCPDSVNSYAFRLEIIGGKFLYVLRIDVSKGFANCPCEKGFNDKFSIVENPKESLPFASGQSWDDFLLAAKAFVKKHKIGTASFEFRIENSTGLPLVYDLNINTNYNAVAEGKFLKSTGIEVSGVEEVCKHINSLR